MTDALMLGAAIFAVALCLQVVAWRLLRVRRELLGLVCIYAVLPAAVAVLLYLGGRVQILDILATGLLYAALVGAYVQTYPALREDIPSFRILFVVATAGAQGIASDQIAVRVNSAGLHTDKVADLDADGLVRVDATGSPQLSAAGRLLAHVFRAYRRMLGLPPGAG